LVLKKVWALFFVATMTTKWKDNKFYYNLDKSYFNKDSSVSLSQVKIIDKKRFFEQIWTISGEDFKNIKKELQNILF
jgi:mRNA-degrading endonuclease toxin of MazEF toxin-antitoxin module